MTIALLTKNDIEQELKISFPASYTDSYFLEIANYALGELYAATNRSTFTGQSAYIAKKIMVCSAMDWISMFDRPLFQSAITSMSEDGKSITFSQESTIKNYKDTFNRLTAKLRLPSAGNYSITMPDIDGTHLSTDTNPLY